MSSGAQTSASSSSLPKKIICVGDIFAAPFYILLTVVALASVVVPVLRDLSAHGKTRLDADGQGADADSSDRKPPSSRPVPPAPALLLRRLSSDLLLVRKTRFVQFYVAGIAVTLLLFILRRIEDTLYPSPIEGHDGRNFGPQGLAVALLAMHLSRRCYECLYVHEWADLSSAADVGGGGGSSSSSRMHAAGYALGVLHYVVLPFVFLGDDDDHDWCCEFSDPTAEERTQRRAAAAAVEGGGADGDGAGFGPTKEALGLIAGAALVCLGQAEQYRHHRILADLRRRGTAKAKAPSAGDPKDRPGKKEKSPYDSYRIPTGRFFDYVSCPHYLAEILIYVGFASLLHCASSAHRAADVRCSLSSSVFGQMTYGWASSSGSVHLAFNLALNLEEYKHIALLVWVVTNLSISAMRNHAWYRRRFGDRYPKRRKALVPFLW